jgi:hypothetical protein
MSTTAHIKKGIKERCHKKPDFQKLREDLRQVRILFNFKN